MLSLRELSTLAIAKQVANIVLLEDALLQRNIDWLFQCWDDVIDFHSVYQPHFLSLLASDQSSASSLDLRKFNCRSCEIEVLLRCGILKRIINLRDLTIGAANLSNYGIAQIAWSLPQLVKLDISGCRGFCIEGLRCLDSIELLDNLNISDCNIDLPYWPLKNRKTLRQVDIGGNSISAVTLRELFDTCGDVVQSLGLWGCSCWGNFNDEICLLRATATLTELDIRWMAPLSTHFYSLLRACTLLQTLRCTPLTSLASAAAVECTDHIALESILYSSFASTLIDVSLQNISISPDVMCSLVHLDSIRHLSLAGSTLYFNLNINQSTAASVASAPACVSLASLTTLRSIDLRQCVLLNASGDIGSSSPPSSFASFLPRSLRALDAAGCTGSLSDVVLSESIRPLKRLRALHLQGVMLSDWMNVLENKTR